MILRTLYRGRWFFAAQAGMMLLTIGMLWWLIASAHQIHLTVSPLAYELYVLSALALPVWSLATVWIALFSMSAMPRSWGLYLLHWIFPVGALWVMCRVAGSLGDSLHNSLPLSRAVCAALPLLMLGLPAVASLLWGLKSVRPRAAAGIALLCLVLGGGLAIVLLVPHYAAVPTQLPFVQGWARANGYRAYGPHQHFYPCALPPSERAVRDQLVSYGQSRPPAELKRLLDALPIPPRAAIDVQEVIADKYFYNDEVAAAQVFLAANLDKPPGFQMARRRVKLARLLRKTESFEAAEEQLLAATAEPIQCTCSLAWSNQAEAELARLYVDQQRYREAYRHAARMRPQREKTTSPGYGVRTREDILLTAFWWGLLRDR